MGPLQRYIYAVDDLTDAEAVKLIEANLAKGPKRGVAKETEADADVDFEETAEEEEAA